MVNRKLSLIAKKAGPNEPAHKYGNLNIRPCGLDFFPKGVGSDGGEIGSTSSLQVGFDWVYIPCGGGAGGVHRALLYKQLCSFGHLVNWVCFA